MNLKLLRTELGGTYTIGTLFADGVDISIFTLEDTVREQEGVPVDEWKIPGITAIPRGEYEVIPCWFGAYQKIMPLLKDVPGFTEIFIHTGNTSLDTKGCILVGSTWEGGDWIGKSRLAFSRLFPMIQTAWDSGEGVKITVL
jgi:hypothetical protein